ncbi:MAG: glycine cleavage system protein GcvH [Acidimicrobiaceae bacterium]|jgi:glycine cleavage system H protein|nr:glycine cleavage system protein GcvH [Acidimicrobiaceae bacterium]MCH9804763.1 glycine cleavage system protein GcvH [bacterium]MDB4818195.1 glycine cleavage system protein GcvH [Acidimicrobiales bacterium]MCO4834017.1 glycine cleavage system protein GcvH [Acidimicrobiaceae bacterium]MDB2392590.1 glycine cleavage system protein GcvH [Acidimicrobiaceae bacterium]
MLVPNDLRYSRDHQWVRVEGDLLRVGITEFAQEALGEVTMVQLADVQTTVAAGDEMGEIEAFKAMTDLYMPVDAVVVEPNAALAVTPTAVNSDPYGQGWLCTVRPSSAADVNSLLDAQAYLELIGYTNG